MEKTCPVHGTSRTRSRSILRSSSAHREPVPGRDVEMTPDSLHDHGSQHHQVRPRRGAHGRPHQPLQHDVRPVLHGREPGGLRPRAVVGRSRRRSSTTPISVKPRRQMSIQFSGGEPTLSPHFLDAIRYARKIGYFAVQCATNGMRFAQEPGFAKAGGRGRPAHGLPAVRRRHQRRQLAPEDRRTCTT
jgi:hypothetical protein